MISIKVGCKRLNEDIFLKILANSKSTIIPTYYNFQKEVGGVGRGREEGRRRERKGEDSLKNKKT